MDAVELMTPAAQREIAGTSSGDVALKAAAAFATYRDLVIDAEVDRSIARVDMEPIKIMGTRDVKPRTDLYRAASSSHEGGIEWLS